METQKLKFALAGKIISKSVDARAIWRQALRTGEGWAMSHLKATPTAWALTALFALVLSASVNLDGPSDHEANLMVAAAVADLEANK